MNKQEYEKMQQRIEREANAFVAVNVVRITVALLMVLAFIFLVTR